MGLGGHFARMIEGAFDIQSPPKVPAGMLKRRILSYQTSPGVREMTGPVSESRRFATAAGTVAAGEKDAMRRIGESAARYRLGPGYATSAGLEVSMRGGATRGALRSQAAGERAQAGANVTRSTLQGLTDVDMLKYAEKMRAVQEHNERMAQIAGTLGSLTGTAGGILTGGMGGGGQSGMKTTAGGFKYKPLENELLYQQQGRDLPNLLQPGERTGIDNWMI